MPEYHFFVFGYTHQLVHMMEEDNNHSRILWGIFFFFLMNMRYLVTVTWNSDVVALFASFHVCKNQ